MAGEFWRKHKSLALEVGAKQVKQMEDHYKRHAGISVSHKQVGPNAFVPVVTSRTEFNRLLKSRGMVDKG